jgi:hypothetical protein
VVVGVGKEEIARNHAKGKGNSVIIKGSNITHNITNNITNNNSKDKLFNRGKIKSTNKQ